MPDHDTLTTVFAEFRDEHLPQIRPAGLAPARVKARRRRRARIAGFSVLTLAMVAVLTPVVANWHLIGGTRRQAPAASSVIPPAASGRPCTTGDVIVQLTGAGSVEAQPWVVISFINESGGPCELTGYPRIVSVSGRPVSALPDGLTNLAVTVANGPLASHTDPGRIPVFVGPGLGASFALGTRTTDGDAYLLQNVTIALPDDAGQFVVAMPTSMVASAPRGQPILITVTGLTAGTAGPAR